MKRERGEYRPIYEALWDGPDFQRLTPSERLVLLALKGKLGSAGIRQVPGVLSALAEWTGHGENTVAKALAALETAGWIQRERSVVWLVRGFEFEPTWDASNPKQRTHIQRLLDGLPSLEIVDRFRAHYAAWMVSPTDGVSHSPPDTPSVGDAIGNDIAHHSPFPSPSPSPLPSSGKNPGRAKTPRDRDATEGGENWLTPFLDLWTARVGIVKPKRCAAALAPVRSKFGDAATLAGLTAYLDEPRPPDKPVRLEWFRDDASRWIQEATARAAGGGALSARVRPIRPEPQSESPSERLARMGAL